MADVVVDEKIQVRPRMSWGGIFGGAVTALALWLLLYSFGLAVGLSSLDPNNPGSVKPSGIFTGIWALVAPLIALFVGGWVAARGANVMARGEGASHGLVMWGLTTLIGASMVAMLMTAIVGGAVSVGKAAVGAGGAAIGAAASGSGGAAKWLGIDANDALGPINNRLRAEGKPAITAGQLETATRDVVQTAVRDGRLNKETLVGSIVQNTRLSRADAEEIGNRVESQYQQASGQIGDRLQAAAQQAQTGALKAADATGKAFWGVFGALLLGLIAALAGGAAAAPGRPRGPRRERVVGAAAVATPREVHP
jgi:hypothetical protein